MGKGRPCSICQHPQREAIDKLLVPPNSNIAAISRDFVVSEDALGRHKASHVPETLAKAEEVGEIARADSLLDQLMAVHRRTEELLSKAEEAGEVRSWPGFLREMREQIKLLAELEGRIASQPQVTLQQVNIYSSPEWRAVGTILAGILAPYPELRAEVAGEFLVLEEANR